jgi:hypothetical protein
MALPLAKSEDEIPTPQSILATTPSSEPAAAAVARAFKEKTVRDIKLGGKHSNGTLLARDPESYSTLLLKPGAGPQNPASGDREDPSSQSKREAAFYAVARLWGLADHVPEAHVILIDGREYAALRMLGHDYQDLNKLRAADPGLPPRLFRLFLHDGSLHKWAAMDYILGNVDRNGGNVMARGDEIQLIDHGSAFAGPDFDPARDQYTFVPYYLRAMTGEGFEKLTPPEKMRALPRLHPTEAEKLGKWLDHLDPELLAQTLQPYGIDPGPEQARLQRLKDEARHAAADLVINAAWTIP